jgi:predicted ATPase
MKNLLLRNIKCFERELFHFSPLTVLCGANSAGKSTVIQSLLLLRQSYNSGSFGSNEIALTGEYFSVGHVNDLISHDAKESVLSIHIDDLCFDVDLTHTDVDSYRMAFKPVTDLNHSLFLNDFVYLCAERHGPRGSYDVRFDSSSLDLGIYGQYAVSEFVKRASSVAINQSLAALYHASESPANSLSASGEEHITLEVAVKTVMRRICPGFDINYKSYDDLDKVSSAFASQSTKGYVRPVNTGFGVSCVLPIIVGAFCLPPGSTFIVENPEVHLHPAAQSELADFLSAVAFTGVQVIIETHSDHIINGIRLFCKNHGVGPDEITINSISRNDQHAPVKFIQIDEDGNLSDTHAGFFDQAEKDLLKLF